jgi:hypothetical protein
MWDPQHLRTPTAYYGDSFTLLTFFFFFYQKGVDSVNLSPEARSGNWNLMRGRSFPAERISHYRASHWRIVFLVSHSSCRSQHLEAPCRIDK